MGGKKSETGKENMDKTKRGGGRQGQSRRREKGEAGGEMFLNRDRGGLDVKGFILKTQIYLYRGHI